MILKMRRNRFLRISWVFVLSFELLFKLTLQAPVSEQIIINNYEGAVGQTEIPSDHNKDEVLLNGELNANLDFVDKNHSFDDSNSMSLHPPVDIYNRRNGRRLGKITSRRDNKIRKIKNDSKNYGKSKIRTNNILASSKTPANLTSLSKYMGHLRKKLLLNAENRHMLQNLITTSSPISSKSETSLPSSISPILSPFPPLGMATSPPISLKSHTPTATPKFPKSQMPNKNPTSPTIKKPPKRPASLSMSIISPTSSRPQLHNYIGMKIGRNDIITPSTTPSRMSPIKQHLLTKLFPNFVTRKINHISTTSPSKEPTAFITRPMRPYKPTPLPGFIEEAHTTGQTPPKKLNPTIFPIPITRTFPTTPTLTERWTPPARWTSPTRATYTTGQTLPTKPTSTILPMYHTRPTLPPINRTPPSKPAPPAKWTPPIRAAYTTGQTALTKPWSPILPMAHTRPTLPPIPRIPPTTPTLHERPTIPTIAAYSTSSISPILPRRPILPTNSESTMSSILSLRNNDVTMIYNSSLGRNPTKSSLSKIPPDVYDEAIKLCNLNVDSENNPSSRKGRVIDLRYNGHGQYEYYIQDYMSNLHLIKSPYYERSDSLYNAPGKYDYYVQDYLSNLHLINTPHHGNSPKYHNRGTHNYNRPHYSPNLRQNYVPIVDSYSFQSKFNYGENIHNFKSQSKQYYNNGINNHVSYLKPHTSEFTNNGESQLSSLTKMILDHYVAPQITDDHSEIYYIECPA